MPPEASREALPTSRPSTGAPAAPPHRAALSRRSLLLGTGAGALALAGCSLAEANGTTSSGSGASGPVRYGISAPLTGPYAEYGKYFRQGFDIALAEINGSGGVSGRQVELVWADSQSDPKQSVPVAQRFVADKKIIAELGDFSSGASMAASPVYQQAGMVQFGYSNSNPLFTNGGDHMWSTAITQADYQKARAALLKKMVKNVAVLYLQTDWGKESFDEFQKSAAKLNLPIVFSSAINPDSQDFRPVLLRTLAARPAGVVHLGYGPDGGLLVKQLRSLGFKGTFSGGQNTPQYLQIAGRAAEGTVLAENFSLNDPNPSVQKFVTAFKAKYGSNPGEFNLYAYDALHVMARATEHGGATRAGVQQGFLTGAPFPTVQFGDVTFGANRRPTKVVLKKLTVVNGQFTVGETL